jgi:hypothetical protein
MRRGLSACWLLTGILPTDKEYFVMAPKTSDDIFDLIDSYLISTALGAALELGLFWLLDEKSLDTTTIAQALDIPL